MLGMNDIRKGRTVVLDGQPYVVTSASYMKKQQGRPVMRCVLKHLQTGQTKEHTFMQSDKVEEADVSRQQWQFLYSDGGQYHFMNQTTYETVELNRETVGDAAQFLLEGEDVEVLLFGETPVTVELPIKIERKVVTAPPGIKGDTSTNVMKEVVLEGGAKVKAPLFVKEGDRIVIDTRTGAYVAKA